MGDGREEGREAGGARAHDDGDRSSPRRWCIFEVRRLNEGALLSLLVQGEEETQGRKKIGDSELGCGSNRGGERGDGAAW